MDNSKHLTSQEVPEADFCKFALKQIDVFQWTSRGCSKSTNRLKTKFDYVFKNIKGAYISRKIGLYTSLS